MSLGAPPLPTGRLLAETARLLRTGSHFDAIKREGGGVRLVARDRIARENMVGAVAQWMATRCRRHVRPMTTALTGADGRPLGARGVCGLWSQPPGEIKPPDSGFPATRLARR